VGRGTGITDEALARKAAVIDEALARHAVRSSDPLDLLSKVGGLEIAVLVGATLEAARLRVPVILDGFVTNAAALIADSFDSAVRAYLLASHASPEPGSRVALAHLGLVPLFDWGMRLGEGTGAVMAVPILRSAVDAHLSMATFATAGIVGRAGYEEKPS
jgi:nicotinate-nucleotide--dimethylbenzimidazole phosphoribosyltransferase